MYATTTSLILLLLNCCCWWSSNAVPEKVFLFAGQSNMEGWSTGYNSIEANASLWVDCLKILNNAPPATRRNQLISRIDAALAARPEYYNSAVSVREADFVLNIQARNLTSGLESPLPGARCEWNQGSAPVQWNPTCGAQFGAELIFSHVMVKESGQTQFRVAKAAHGGTQIRKDWYPFAGTYWSDVANKVNSASAGSIFHGFAWQQGEYDVFLHAGDATGAYNDYKRERCGNSCTPSTPNLHSAILFHAKPTFPL
jgi:Carbohydrate esterase, sialic acid-specific acetylesterase